MAEYWKSTPRYWCKHCSMYVRDTKLDRANHEATGKHRGGVERALRDLHRGHERDVREKERARREIERLNGIVGGPSSSSSSADAGASKPRTGPPPPPPQPQQQAEAAGLSKEQRQAQLEQLVAMGVSIPEELRADMAMAGDWTVTKVRVVDGDGDGTGAKTADTAGVRGKRERDKTEDEVEAEEAAEGLFKRPKRWGRGDSKAGGGEDAELEALLGGDVAIKKTKEGDDGDEKTAVKKEDEGGANKEDCAAAAAPVKKEERLVDVAPVRDEPRDEESGIGASVPGDAGAAPAVMFKKRKPKNIRQR